MEEDRQIKLQTDDDKEFEVAESVIKMSTTVKNMIEGLRPFHSLDLGDLDEAIPLPTVKSTILEKIIFFCEHHVNDAPEKESKNLEIDPWDQKFADVDQATLFELILAANYLDIKPLLDLTCKTVANMIKGKTPEQIRKTFNIKNDFTPEVHRFYSMRRRRKRCARKMSGARDIDNKMVFCYKLKTMSSFHKLVRNYNVTH